MPDRDVAVEIWFDGAFLKRVFVNPSDLTVEEFLSLGDDYYGTGAIPLFYMTLYKGHFSIGDPRHH